MARFIVIRNDLIRITFQRVYLTVVKIKIRSIIINFVEYLDKKQLEEVDKKIDSRIQTFKLLKRPKDQAIYCVLLYFDLWMNELGKDMNLDRRKNLYRHSYQGLNHLIEA